jgi:hypothetical protein
MEFSLPVPLWRGFATSIMANAEAGILIQMSNDGSKCAFFELVSLEKFKDYRGFMGLSPVLRT